MDLKMSIFLLTCALGYALADTENNQLQCFVPGQCLESYQLHTMQTEDQNGCLENCKPFENCNWFTFYPSIKICKFFTDCVKLDASGCTDCVSGQSECTSDPICWAKGECRGIFLEMKKSDSKEECLNLCKQEPKCNWFTYFTDASICELFNTCPERDETCNTCVSGERTCDDAPTQEMVALIVGGEGSTDAEVYSPEGGCQHSLGFVTGSEFRIWRPVVAYLNGQIISCSSERGSLLTCWTYDLDANSWEKMLTAPNVTYDFMPGSTYGGKIFFLSDEKPVALEPATGTWEEWPKMPKRTGDDPCMVTWKNNFIVLGGASSPRSVQVYDHVTRTWTVKKSNATMDLSNSGCTVLPDNDILVVGSETLDDFRSAAIYNFETDTWTKLENTNEYREGTSLVTLGTRVFAIGGLSQVIEEFDYTTRKWSVVSEPMLSPQRMQHSSISVPASLFSNFTGGCSGVF